MKTVSEIRLQNFLNLAQQEELFNRFCERVGIQESYGSRIKSKDRPVGNTIARRVEQRLGLPEGWMDASHETAQPQTQEGPSSAGIALLIDRLPVATRTRLISLIHAMVSDAAQAK